MACCWLLAAPATLLAQAAGAAAPALHAPRQVHVRVHRAVADQRFMPLLMRQLGQALAMPLQQGRFAIALPATAAGLNLWPMDAQPLIDALLRDMAPGDAGSTHIFIVASDLRLKPARYNLAASWGGAQAPLGLSIVSLHRLQTLDGQGRDTDPQRTADRVFKLVAKNVARLAGYAPPEERCLMAFPQTAADLDALPENFCEPDLAALVQAGIAARPAAPGARPVSAD